MFANRPSFLSNLPPVVRNLLIINALLWLATYTLGHKIDLNYYLGMHYWQSEEFNPAQFFIYMFMHDSSSIWHLFFNMFALYMFGRVLEQAFGSKRFLFYYIMCGIGAAIAQQIVWTFRIDTILNQLALYGGNMNHLITVGASGSVFGLLLGFGYLFPNQRIMLLIPPIPIKAKYFVIIYALIELFQGVRNSSGDNIAHFAHLGGLVAGLLLLWYWKKNPLDRFKQQ